MATLAYTCQLSKGDPGPEHWFLPETQLSRQTQKSCAARLCQVPLTQNRNLRIHMGCPLAVRTNCAQTMWNQPKVFTCKGKSERDLLWLSPEGQALCREVDVQDHFMEHSTVSVGLCFPSKALLLRTWPRPSAIPYEALDPAWRQQAEPPVWDDAGDVGPTRILL